MASSKYANLPDIDSSRDVYETEDPEPSSQREHDDSSDEEARKQNDGQPSEDDKNNRDHRASPELVRDHLEDPSEARKHFKQQERKRSRRVVYTYPPSPSASRSPSPSGRVPPIQDRIRSLERELAAIEVELSNPSTSESPASDPAEMLRGLVDMRTRIANAAKESAGHFDKSASISTLRKEKVNSVDLGKPSDATKVVTGQPDGLKPIADMDARVAQLEKLIGSNTVMIDETTPLPQPLLPQMSKLARQITLLSNNKNVESVSRRLKLLLADLERLNSVTSARRGATQKDGSTGGASGTAAVISTLPPDLAPLLARLSPLLPTIPHLLQRLRTLSTLHTSASSFASTLGSLEDDQKRVRAALEDLNKAVEGVEASLEENEGRIESNMKGLEERVNELNARVNALQA